MNSSFMALIFRMKYINRWGLKHNIREENLSEHTAECAFLTHFIATIGNVYFEKKYDADKLAATALFHDASEILTGDLPTPVKYYNSEIKSIYKNIEDIAGNKLLDQLPDEMRAVYENYFLIHDNISISDDEKLIIKIADKLCAYIKCVKELDGGNKEFQNAYFAIERELEAIESQELKYFMDNYLHTFSLSIDEIGVSL